MSLKYVVFLCLIFKVSAWDGKCPEHVETMPDFKPELYLGDWYNTFTTYNSYLDETSHCIRASYKELSMPPFIGVAPGHDSWRFVRRQILSSKTTSKNASENLSDQNKVF